MLAVRSKSVGCAAGGIGLVANLRGMRAGWIRSITVFTRWHSAAHSFSVSHNDRAPDCSLTDKRPAAPSLGGGSFPDGTVPILRSFEFATESG
jgi:hypothetical protein